MLITERLIDADRAQLDGLDERTLIAAVRGTSMYARVSPRHKLHIAVALQSGGSVVAMTGSPSPTPACDGDTGPRSPARGATVP